jgi:glycosyltransferase involved in cell wall biosynthesis
MLLYSDVNLTATEGVNWRIDTSRASLIGFKQLAQDPYFDMASPSRASHVGDNRRMPAVSVAITAYNSGPWVADAVHSALEQTMRDIEVVVVDDASADDTFRVVAAIDDTRLRLYRNVTNLGEANNWNRTVSLCRSPLVKLLCSDDTLDRTCVEKMSKPFSDRTVGMVFSRRRILGDQAHSDCYGSGHRHLGELREVNSGRPLFELQMHRGFDDNWVGEPSNVMLRSDVFRTTCFDPRVVRTDMAMWIRTMFHYDVGFVDEELATYRVRSGSVTDSARSSGSRWLDRLWLYEILLEDAAIDNEYGVELRRLRRRERMRMPARLFLKYGRHWARWTDAAAYLREQMSPKESLGREGVR